MGLSKDQIEMNDFKFAFRQLLKNPGFTAVAVLTLAPGIGLNTGIFTILNGVALRPLPVPGSEKLVNVFQDLSGNRERDAESKERPQRRGLLRSGLVATQVAACMGTIQDCANMSKLSRRPWIRSGSLAVIGMVVAAALLGSCGYEPRTTEPLRIDRQRIGSAGKGAAVPSANVVADFFRLKYLPAQSAEFHVTSSRPIAIFVSLRQGNERSSVVELASTRGSADSEFHQLDGQSLGRWPIQWHE